MLIVQINGPAGAGKNTLAEATKKAMFAQLNRHKILRPRSLAWRIGIEEFKRPLIDMLFSFAESLSLIELGTDRNNHKIYEDLKVTKMLGLTGREWMFVWSDAMREKNELVFVEFLTTKIHNMNLDIAIVPDWGFPHEMLMPSGANQIVRVYLDGWKKDVPIYQHGDKFTNDIRICLRDDAHMQNPSPEALATYCTGIMADLHRERQSSLAL